MCTLYRRGLFGKDSQRGSPFYRRLQGFYALALPRDEIDAEGVEYGGYFVKGDRLAPFFEIADRALRDSGKKPQILLRNPKFAAMLANDLGERAL